METSLATHCDPFKRDFDQNASLYVTCTRTRPKETSEKHCPKSQKQILLLLLNAELQRRDIRDLNKQAIITWFRVRIKSNNKSWYSNYRPLYASSSKVHHHLVGIFKIASCQVLFILRPHTLNYLAAATYPLLFNFYCIFCPPPRCCCHCANFGQGNSYLE